MTTTFDRPVAAKLIVRLDNGEEWEATPEDLEKFRLVNRNDAYTTVRTALIDILRKHGLLAQPGGHSDGEAREELTDTELNPLRYFIETALAYPDLLDLPEHAGWPDVADLERRLRTTTAPVPDDATH